VAGHEQNLDAGLQLDHGLSQLPAPATYNRRDQSRLWPRSRSQRLRLPITD
jgi:hypothetical protein